MLVKTNGSLKQYVIQQISCYHSQQVNTAASVYVVQSFNQTSVLCIQRNVKDFAVSEL